MLIRIALRSVVLLPTMLAIFAAPLALQAATAGVETWDDGGLAANGWIGNTVDSTVVHIPAGGNPNGHIQARRSGPFDIGALIDQDDDPTSRFTGDYAGIIGANVDLRFVSGDFTDAWIRFRTGATVNGWRYPLTNVFPANVWNTYSAPIDANWTDAEALLAGWIQEDATSGTWASNLAAVDTAEVRIGGSSSSLLVDIDNFTLAVPEPATACLLLAALVAAPLGRRRR